MDIGRDKTVAEVIRRLEAAKSGEGAVKVEGTWGSFAPLLAVHISKKLGRGILYVRPHIDDAENIADDMHSFGAKDVEVFNAWEGEEDLADATDEIRAERLKIVSRISLRLRSGQAYLVSRSKRDDFIIATSVQALCQPIPKPDALRAGCLRLGVDKELSPEYAAGWLVDNGFERVERIDLPGQFARRGGIIDIYAPLTIEKVLGEGQNDNVSSQGAEAVRIEFFGDTIETVLSKKKNAKQQALAAYKTVYEFC